MVGSFKSIAKQNNISHALLMIWVDKFRRGRLTDEIDYAEKTGEHEATIAALTVTPNLSASGGSLHHVGQFSVQLNIYRLLAPRLVAMVAPICTSVSSAQVVPTRQT